MPATYKTKQLLNFPIEFMFKTRVELDEYLGQDRIQCLRCGRWLRTLGVHLLKKHQMSTDEYREIYGIPWRDGLCCKENSEKHSIQSKRVIKKRLDKGDVLSTPERRAIAHKTTHRKFQPLALNEFNKRTMKRHELLGHTGEDARRRERAPKRGTAEFHKKMQARPQCKNNRAFYFWWKGKKQSAEHVKKRVHSNKITLQVHAKAKGETA